MQSPETNPISLFFNAIANYCPSLIATMLIGTTCYLWLNGKPVTEFLEKLDLIVVSFLFGTKFGREK